MRSKKTEDRGTRTRSRGTGKQGRRGERWGFILLLSTLYSLLSPAYPVHAIQTEKISSEDLIPRIQHRYKTISSLKARFQQVITLASIPSDKRSRGHVYFLKPGRMKWTYNEPEGQFVMVNDKKLIMYFPETDQLVEREVVPGILGNIPMAFLMGLGDIANDFDILECLLKEMGDRDQIISIRMTPRERIPQVKELNVEFLKTDLIIKSVLITDYMDNKNLIEFNEVELNPEIPPSLFQFRPNGVKRD